MFPSGLQLAIGVARSGPRRDFRHGAVGIRRDGAIVTSINATATHPFPAGHAEARVVRKIDKGAIVYVARVDRVNGEPANSTPCPRCLARLRSKGVTKVFFTLGPTSYACEYL